MINATTHLGRFRIVAIAEGISYLLLLFLAMPLKYLADIPSPVRYVGWVHGLLFVLYCLFLLLVWINNRWSFLKVLTGFVASLLPFGAFWFDRRIRD